MNQVILERLQHAENMAQHVMTRNDNRATCISAEMND
jgi:hypothetical protein